MILYNKMSRTETFKSKSQNIKVIDISVSAQTITERQRLEMSQLLARIIIIATAMAITI